MAHKKNPLDWATASPPIHLGIGWYTPHQWLLLKQAADDPDRLDDSHEEWLSGAEHTERELRQQGYTPHRVMIDVESLVAWCKEHGRPLNGSARAKYVSERLQAEARGKLE